MPRESMDAFEALRKVAADLQETKEDLSDSFDLDRRLDDASMMILYIVEALEHEIRLAQRRGQQQQAARILELNGIQPSANPPAPADFYPGFGPETHLKHWQHCNCLADKATCCQDDCMCRMGDPE